MNKYKKSYGVMMYNYEQVFQTYGGINYTHNRSLIKPIARMNAYKKTSRESMTCISI